MKIIDATNNCEVITSATQVSEIFRSSLETWHALKQGDEMPRWEIDHLMAFPTNLIPYTNVTVRDPETGDYRFLFWGSGRTGMMKIDYTNKMLSELEPRLYADLVRQEMDEALASGLPLKSSVQVRLNDGTISQVDKVRFPFADKNGDAMLVLSLDDVYQFLKRHYLSWQSRTGG